MKVEVLTLFPEMFADTTTKDARNQGLPILGGPLGSSILKRARQEGKMQIRIHNLRAWATDKHKTVDDSPYGGGVGMVMKVDVIDHALAELKSEDKRRKTEVILLTPQGKRFNQKMAQKLSRTKNIILVCGHYEGFDERVRMLVDHEISIGDYVLTGGELPAMVLIDSIARLIPGVLGKDESSHDESFSIELAKNNNLGFGNCKLSRFAGSRVEGKIENLLEYPQFTRPEKYLPLSINRKKTLTVPNILLTGNHKKINEWRMLEAKTKTQKKRPDLLDPNHKMT